VECFTGEHLRMLPFAVICATLYSVGLVVGFWALLYYHRDELSDLAVKQRYGALYRLFRYGSRHCSLQLDVLTMILCCCHYRQAQSLVLAGYDPATCAATDSHARHGRR